MNELILHIGYPKTGTTTIQKKWLGKFTNQINPFDTSPHKRQLKKQIADGFRNHHPSYWDTNQGKQIAFGLAEMIGNEGGKLIHSHEGLSMPYFFRPLKQPGYLGIEPHQFPVAEHLKSFLSIADRIDRTQVIVTLRNQADWIGSLYSQQSHLIKNPSQAHFECSVRSVLSDPSTKGWGFVNYHALVTALADVVGKGSVHVFFLEEINTPEYWDRLSKITGLPVDTSSMTAPSAGRENVRGVGEGHWGLRPDERYKTYWSFKKINQLSPYIGQSYKKIVDLFKGKSRGSIEMTEVLSRDIKSRVRESNKTLEKWLGRPLPKEFW